MRKEHRDSVLARSAPWQGLANMPRQGIGKCSQAGNWQTVPSRDCKSCPGRALANVPRQCTGKRSQAGTGKRPRQGLQACSGTGNVSSQGTVDVARLGTLLVPRKGTLGIREVRWVRRDTRLTIRVTVWGRGLGGTKSQRVGRLRRRTQPGLSPVPERTGKLAPLTPFYSIIEPVVQFFGRLSFLLWQSWLVRLRLT